MNNYLRTSQRKSVKVLHILVVALLAAILCSCDESPLLSDHSPFSKEEIKRSLLKRADRVKQPLLIESVSDVEPMTLHGEKCWSAMAFVKDGQGFSTPIFFVTKQGRDDYLYGGHDLISGVDEKGYNVVIAELAKQNSQNSSPTQIPESASTPENAPTPENVGGVSRAKQEIINGQTVTVLPIPTPDE
jgi:hypothetical protein